MKQKMVIRVSVTGEKKSRSKAMQTAVGVPGVESIALEGEDKNQIVVIGDSVDSVKLTCLLRKKIGPAELLSVSPVDEKKQKENMTESGVLQPMVWPPYQAGVPQYYYSVVREDKNNYDTCSIM
ncbi:disease resistance protein Pikm1-TS-like [Vitis riparia]|uniref:disease resistance protein Pikm1-TS-like n=1 Tax=Vitis riparia TaxID=96939 RepID=UPI00155AF615|nr:disease resistance protein Pikm1-TS-like [Vitis riparia]